MVIILRDGTQIKHVARLYRAGTDMYQIRVVEKHNRNKHKIIDMPIANIKGIADSIMAIKSAGDGLKKKRKR